MFLRTTSNLIVSRNLGPIIHITPDKLDFNNPEFYEVIYSTSQDIDKPLWAKYQSAYLAPCSPRLTLLPITYAALL